MIGYREWCSRYRTPVPYYRLSPHPVITGYHYKNLTGYQHNAPDQPSPYPGISPLPVNNHPDRVITIPMSLNITIVCTLICNPKGAYISGWGGMISGHHHNRLITTPTGYHHIRSLLYSVITISGYHHIRLSPHLVTPPYPRIPPYQVISPYPVIPTHPVITMTRYHTRLSPYPVITITGK